MFSIAVDYAPASVLRELIHKIICIAGFVADVYPNLFRPIFSIHDTWSEPMVSDDLQCVFDCYDHLQISLVDGGDWQVANMRSVAQSQILSNRYCATLHIPFIPPYIPLSHSVCAILKG